MQNQHYHLHLYLKRADTRFSLASHLAMHYYISSKADHKADQSSMQYVLCARATDQGSWLPEQPCQHSASLLLETAQADNLCM